MLTGVVVPRVAATELKSMESKSKEKDFKENGPESFSFGKALDDKMSAKKEPKEIKDSSSKEAKVQNQEKENPDKPEETKTKKNGPEVVRAENKPPKKATGRQQAIQDFMDSFESEFEIPPTRLVEAMAQLKDSQLNMAPEDTAEAVIEKLDLPPEQTERAQAMYAALLSQLNQMSTSAKEPNITVSSGMTKQGMQDRIFMAQSRQDQMLQSVDQLNSKFWTNPNLKPEDSQIPGMPRLANMEVDESSFAQNPKFRETLAQDAKMSTDFLDKLPPHLQGQMKENLSPALLAALAAKQAEQAHQKSFAGQASSESTETLDASDGEGNVPNTFEIVGATVAGNEALKAEEGSSSGQDMSSGSDKGSSFTSLHQGTVKSAAKAVTSTGEVVKESLKKSDLKESLLGLEGGQVTPLKGEALKSELVVPAGATFAAGAAPTKMENEANVKQLMNQAQYLIKKGGGEMKVEMSPEGMGTIHLKVMLQDGKVNMQMSADTQEAKKTIESSLAELKTSLAAHKLSMENVKVDVVNSTSADTATQNQTNMNNQQQRDQQTRQFWNQFNDSFGSQGRKESLLEMPTLRGYGKKQRDPLQPIESKSSDAGRKVEGKGAGLNLVA